MFKIAQKPTFVVPVEVYLQGDTTKHTFDIEFKRLTKPELDDMKEKVRTNKITDREISKSIVVGWSGIRDEQGELAFSESNLDMVLDINLVERSIIAEFFSSANGARQKN